MPVVFVVNNKVLKGKVEPEVASAFWNSPDFSLIGIPGYAGLALMLLGHVLAAIVLFICVRAFHKRSFRTVITARRPFDWKRFGVAFAIWFVLTAIMELVLFLIEPDSYTFQLDAGKWIPLVFVSLLIIPIQTSIEEIFIRGYLFQGIAMGTRSVLVAVLLTSIIFTGMHMANPEVAKFGLGVMVVYYMSVAVFLAVLTFVDDGLELALGVHAATNIYGAAFVTFDGSVMQAEAMLFAWQMSMRGG